MLRIDLGLPGSIALFAFGYNALVVLVKFVLAPRGLYEVSEAGELEAYFDPSDAAAAIFIGSVVAIGIGARMGNGLLITNRCQTRVWHA